MVWKEIYLNIFILFELIITKRHPRNKGQHVKTIYKSRIFFLSSLHLENKIVSMKLEIYLCFAEEIII